MKNVIWITCTLVLISMGPLFAASATEGGYYLVSRPIPMGQTVPQFSHRDPSRKYASYLWILTGTEKGVQLKKITGIPIGGGVQQIRLWPDASLLAVSGWPNGYGWDQNLDKGKWQNGELVELINLSRPDSSIKLWLPVCHLRLVAPPKVDPKLALHFIMNMSGGFSTLNLRNGGITRANPFHIPWQHTVISGGPSKGSTFLWANLQKNGSFFVAPEYPAHWDMNNLKYFVKLPWRIPTAILKQAAGSNPKYTWMLANTPSMLAIGRPNMHEPTTKLLFLILDKMNLSWSAHWIRSGDWFRLWSLGSWVVVRLYLPDYHDAVGSATGEYWFFNPVTGQSWQQKLGGPSAWILYMNSRHALVRDGNDIFQYAVRNNRLADRLLLCHDKRIRNVYWACPIPKARPYKARFFWEQPGWRTPRVLQPPPMLSPTTQPEKQ